MKLTKLVHSCLLIENDGDATIFDPGEMSYAAGLLDIARLPRLDRIVITHVHPDHFSGDFVAALVARFPDVRIITTPEVAVSLKAKGITAQTEGDDKAELFEAPHESTAPLSPPPFVQNIGVNFNGQLTHPGDCLHLSATKDILALPVDAPWGSTLDAVRLATELKPKYIVPIHDWMWTDTWRSDFYDRLEKYFKGIGITFLKPVDGQAIEL